MSATSINFLIEQLWENNQTGSHPCTQQGYNQHSFYVSTATIIPALAPRPPWSIRVTYSAPQTSIGSLRYPKGDGGENAPQKVNSRSLKLQCDYHNSLTLSNAGKLSWSWILKKFKFRERKRNWSSLVHVVDETRHLAIHFVVVEWRQRNVQKSVVHVQSCCFANPNLLLFWRSRCPRRSVILTSLMCNGALLYTQTKFWKFYLFNRLLASRRNSMVLPFKWNLFGSTFTWYYLFCM